MFELSCHRFRVYEVFLVQNDVGLDVEAIWIVFIVKFLLVALPDRSMILEVLGCDRRGSAKCLDTCDVPGDAVSGTDLFRSLTAPGFEPLYSELVLSRAAEFVDLSGYDPVDVFGHL